MLIAHAGADCRTYLGRKKNFQTNGCVHVSACSFKVVVADARNSGIAAVLFLFPRDRIETVYIEGVIPWGMWKLCGTSLGCVSLMSTFELRLKGLGMCSRMPDRLGRGQTCYLFFLGSQHSQSGLGWIYIDRARVLELRLLARHVAPRWRDGGRGEWHRFQWAHEKVEIFFSQVQQAPL